LIAAAGIGCDSDCPYNAASVFAGSPTANLMRRPPERPEGRVVISLE
jgi:hypothetical protein